MGRAGPAPVTQPDPIAPPRRAATAFIFVTVLLDMLAIGLVIPVLPRLIVEFLGGDTPRAAEIFGLFGTAWAFMQFIFSPVLGALSDRFGRRPVILLSNLGLGLDYVVMALAPTLGWLLVGRVLSGITAASVATAFAYIADVTPAERRAAAFGMIGAAFGVGFVLGPALGGLLGGIDLRLPFWAAAGMSLLNFLYGLFVLPESLPKARRAPFAWRRANPVGALALLRGHPGLLGLAGAGFLGQLAHVVLPSVSVLYMTHRYGWSETTVGLALAAVGVASMVVQGGLVGPLVARLGERTALLFGLAAGAAGFTVYGLAPTGAWFVAGIPVMALWGIASPAVQGLMSRRVGPEAQGRLQGANSSLQGIAGLIGPGLFTLTFAFFIEGHGGWTLPGAPFLLAAVLLAGAGAVAWRATRAGEGAGDSRRRKDE
ncbi:MAG: TCR/Tet family MFS transporter [Alphaproteobacteria bacterium]|nr:TCR/Tet family MFS transporter [Alphaproteobacteria bacterium]